MVDELIEIIGIDTMKYEIINEPKMENAIYIKVQLDGTVNEDDILITKAKDKKEDTAVKDIKKLKWFKEREFFGEAIKNKYINKSSSITSNQENIIMYNNKNIKIKVGEEYTEIVSSKIIKHLETLGSLNSDIFLMALKTVEGVLKNKSYSDFKVYLVLDEEMKKFKKEFERYLDKIPNPPGNKKLKEKMDKLELCSSPLFVGRGGGKKPLITNMNLENKEISLIKKEDIYKNFIFQKFIRNKAINSRPYSYNTQKGRILFKIIINEASTTKCIENVVYELNGEKSLKHDIVVLGVVGGKDTIIKNTLDIKTKLWLLAKTDENINEKEKDRKLNDFKRNFGYIEKSLEFGEMDLFKRDFKKIINKLIKIHLNSYEEENRFKLNNILEFAIAMEDYINNTRKGKEMLKIIENSMEKVKQLKTEEYVIESNEEFNFLVGQVASYLKSKSKVKEKTNRLIREYLKAEKLEGVMKLLCKDFTKHAAEEKEFSRINKLYGKILEYSISEKVEFDKKMFMIGLVNTKKIIYVEGDK